MNDVERMYRAELERRFDILEKGIYSQEDEKREVEMLVALDKQYQSHLDRDERVRAEDSDRRLKEKEYELKKAQLEFDKKKFETDKVIRESEVSVADRKIAMEESRALAEEQIGRDELALKRDQLDIDRQRLTMEKETRNAEQELRKEELELKKQELGQTCQLSKKDRVEIALDVAEKIFGIIASTAATMIGIRTTRKLVELGYGFEYADLGIKRSQTFKDLSKSAMHYL